MSYITKNKYGFTIIEIIVALSIFVVGVVALYPLFSGSLNILGEMQRTMRLVNAGQTKMAEIEAQGFRGIMDMDDDTETGSFPAPLDDIDFEITRTSTVTDVVSGDTVLWRVGLVVSNPGRGGVREERFVTYISKMRAE